MKIHKRSPSYYYIILHLQILFVTQYFVLVPAFTTTKANTKYDYHQQYQPLLSATNNNNIVTSNPTSITRINMKNDDINHYKKKPTGDVALSKRLSKQIYACGKNYKAALTKLFHAYPFLEFAIDEDDDSCRKLDNTMETKVIENDIQILFDTIRPISSTIDVLGKTNQPSLGLKLLDKVMSLLATYQEDRTPTSKQISFTHLVYKSIIGMIGQTIPKQQCMKSNSSNHIANMMNGEYILQLLYYDLPMKTCIIPTCENQNHPANKVYEQSSPPIDLYHNTVSALGKCRRMDLVMKVIHDMEHSTCIEIHISSNCSIKYVLPMPDATLYSTALTAAIRCKAYNESIHILQSMKQNNMNPSILAYNQVLSCISNAGSMFRDGTDERYHLTKKILNELENDIGSCDENRVIPTESTYQIIMAIYAKENRWDDVKEIKQKMIKNDIDNAKNNVDITVTDANHLSSSKVTDSSKNYIERNVRRGSVESIHGKEMTLDVSLYADESIILQHMKDLKSLEKMAMRRPIWYKLGEYIPGNDDSSDDVAFLFGIQTHRNPSENGISIVFHEANSFKKLGYMLIRNTVGPKRKNRHYQDVFDEEDFILYSSFMGMFIDEENRGKKLTAKFLAIWLLICLKSNALPMTEIINKPLLSLVLTKFGFVPCNNDDSGVEVEICPLSSIQDKPKQENSETGWYPNFAMYSSSIRPDDGTFGERELRIQKMMITKFQPNPRGQITFVKTPFDHPIVHVFKSNGSNTEYRKAKSNLLASITKSLGEKEGEDNVKVSFSTDDNLLRRAVFGFLYNNNQSEPNTLD